MTEKKTIRNAVIRKRDNISLDERKRKNDEIKNYLLSIEEFSSSDTVCLYAAFRSEVATSELLKASMADGKKVLLPKVDRDGHTLKLYEIRDMKELQAGFMGIPEPSPSDNRLASIDEVDVVVIPGAAFDYSGNRLGYGEGYYDILLSGKKGKVTIIALAYEEQIVDALPAEDHDVKVDIIVTDKRVIRI
ncbi:MAG: 5-formyltetrahydrofolate cyclo-ligase [Nitrospirota bacterium]